MFYLLGLGIWSILCFAGGSFTVVYLATHDRKVKELIDGAYTEAEANGELLPEEGD